MTAQRAPAVMRDCYALDGYLLDGCGCFRTPYEDWLCSLHRGQTEAQRQADAQQQVQEALDMNGWIDVGAGPR